MAKRKLTDKLKKQIKENPYRLRQADFSGDALAYLHKVRGARKAVKTKAKKEKYHLPKKRISYKTGKPQTPKDLYNAILKESGLTEKQFRKKFPDAQKLSEQFKVSGNREIDQLKDDILFSIPKGAGVYVNGKRVKQAKAHEMLTRLKGKILRTGLTYERIGVEYTFDAKGNMYLKIPTMKELNAENEDSDADGMLDYISENYPVHIVRK
jgi:hypothetical protein